MRTSSETLDDNKVKLTIEVDEEEILQAQSETLVRLTQEARVPGFRPGRVPRKVLEARIGPKALREEVLRDAMPKYLSDALDEGEFDVIATPEVEVTEGEESGPLIFDAVLELRPKVSIAGYQGLVVTVPSPVASEEEIAAQIDRMREQFASLNEVSRPARDGDLVTLNVHGTRDGEPAEGLTADDLVYQVGSGGIVEGIDEKLFGTSVGDVFEMDADDAPDGPAHLRVEVKQIREKILPDVDDAFAADASEYETLEELRSDLANRINAMKRFQSVMALRERSVEALVELVVEEPPQSLVGAESQTLLQDFVHRLSHEGVSFEAYLANTNQDAESFLAGLEAQAVKQVKADLALRALGVAEEIEVDESDLDEEIVRIAAQAGQKPFELRDMLEKNGRLSALRSEVRNQKALNWLTEHVSLVDEDGNPVDRASIQGIDLLEATDGERDHDHDDHDHDEHDHHSHDHANEVIEES